MTTTAVTTAVTTALKNVRTVLLKNKAFINAITKNRATTDDERAALNEYQAAFNACVPIVNAAMKSAQAALPPTATKREVFFAADNIRSGFNATVAKYKAEARKSLPKVAKPAPGKVDHSATTTETVTFEWTPYELSDGGTYIDGGTMTLELPVVTLHYKGYERKLAATKHGFIIISADNKSYYPAKELFTPWDNQRFIVWSLVKHKNDVRRCVEQRLANPTKHFWVGNFSKIPA